MLESTFGLILRSLVKTASFQTLSCRGGWPGGGAGGGGQSGEAAGSWLPYRGHGPVALAVPRTRRAVADTAVDPGQRRAGRRLEQRLEGSESSPDRNSCCLDTDWLPPHPSPSVQGRSPQSHQGPQVPWRHRAPCWVHITARPAGVDSLQGGVRRSHGDVLAAGVREVCLPSVTPPGCCLQPLCPPESWDLLCLRG